MPQRYVSMEMRAGILAEGLALDNDICDALLAQRGLEEAELARWLATIQQYIFGDFVGSADADLLEMQQL